MAFNMSITAAFSRRNACKIVKYLASITNPKAKSPSAKMKSDCTCREYSKREKTYYFVGVKVSEALLKSTVRRSCRRGNLAF